MKIKVVRIFNTFGPRMHPNDGRVISNFIVQALNDKDFQVLANFVPVCTVIVKDFRHLILVSI